MFSVNWNKAEIDEKFTLKLKNTSNVKIKCCLGS